MKRILLGTVISSILVANVHALSLTEAKAKVGERMAELAELASDSTNITEKNGKRYLNVRGQQLEVNGDGQVMFSVPVFAEQFTGVFDFPATWESAGHQDGGFTLVPPYGNWDGCYIVMIPAKGAVDGLDGVVDQGRTIVIETDTSTCTTTGEKDHGSLVFNQNPVVNDLSGALAGGVFFAQAHVMPAQNPNGEKRQRLVSQRQTLVMFKPMQPLNTLQPMTLTVKAAGGAVLGTVPLNDPLHLPPTVQYHQGFEDLDHSFNYDPSKAYGVPRLTDEAIATALASHDVIKVSTWNGHWARTFSLPEGQPEHHGKIAVFQSSAGYNSTIYYSGRSLLLPRGYTRVLLNNNGSWASADDLLFNDVVYGEGLWSGIVPAEWVQPGMTLEFTHHDKTGQLAGVSVGAPSELLVHTIDVGMLTSPRGQYPFQADESAQQEYFETIPVSRMIVNNYEPLHLTEVMLPDGTLLTDFDPSVGSLHKGTMRQHTGKELISIGINNANYGINSSIGVGESQKPYLAAQLTAHNNRGVYANGLVTHGGSGGGGLVTLDASVGNELSHEFGHNYGLNHYPGGFAGSVHQHANMPNATWGWKSSSNRFVPNFRNTVGGETCLYGQCVAPFGGLFPMGTDAMAAGSAPYSQLRYTMYTPYAMSFIQNFLETKVVFDESSSTGFRQWNGQTQTMDEYAHSVSPLETMAVHPAHANAEFLADLFMTFDRATVATENGYWARNFSLPPASLANKGRVFVVTSKAGYYSDLAVNGGTVRIYNGTQHLYVSNGETWVKDGHYTENRPRRPEQFGVPVTTLVGYYDPESTLPSYIYPAMHGGYGFVYTDDSDTLSSTACALQVETATGKTYRYGLLNNRQSVDSMNKFHVNIARADNPTRAEVVCRDKVIAQAQISQPTMAAKFTVKGQPLPTAVQPRMVRMGIQSAAAEQTQGREQEPVAWVPASDYVPEACAHHDHDNHDHFH